MKCLIDVDALSKLAHWRLLDDLPAVLGVPLVDLSTLTSVRFRAFKAIERPDGRVFHSREAAKAVLATLDSMSPPLDVASSGFSAFQDLPGIDAGEAVLLSTLAGSQDTIMLTGDKRALRALTGLTPADRAPLGGRIVLIEQVLMRVLSSKGVEYLRERVRPFKHIDKAIAMSLGGNCDANEESVREGLESYIREIAQACEPTLLADLG